jgi:glutamate-1-semialdehyde 2,1-aminomutase
MIGMASINRSRLEAAMRDERDRFLTCHPRSQLLAQKAQHSLLAGVPMPWMTRWPGSHPVFCESANGARFVDVDGNSYIDFCLGDTGAMTGHANEAVAQAISTQSLRGLTTMLPSVDALEVSRNLAQRFGLPKWQFAVSATDANRFVLRFSRFLKGRPKIVVHDWCYHGTVDETLVIIDSDGATVSRPGAIGPQVDPAVTTVAVAFNDLQALDTVLARGDVSAVLIEPALTNIGIVLPEEGYLTGVRNITRKHDVLLIVDETHTICAGPGGCTRAWSLDPDFIVIGKTIGGGIPVAAYGMTKDIANELEHRLRRDDVDVSGVGGTLSGSALAMAAMRATLSNALLDEHFAIAIPLASRWTRGVAGVIAEFGLGWHVQQLGCRAEYWFGLPPRDGRDAAGKVDHELETYLHLAALNRGVLLTPFHNMALLSPMHTETDVDTHTAVFKESVEAII